MAVPQRYFIGTPSTGLQNDLKPFAIPDDAFTEMTNAYVFRGRVRKRFGSRLMQGATAIDDSVAQLQSRVRIQVGVTDAVTGDFSAVMPGVIGAIGQLFSVGDTIFTVYQAVGATLTTGAATATYNTGTRALAITGNNENPLTPVYFYPSQPIMGLITFEDSTTNNNPVYAFDTQFAYEFTNSGWEILGPVPPAANSAIWTSTNSDFFWGTTYRGIDAFQSFLFVTNFVAADNMYYYNRVTNTWTVFAPVFDGADFIKSARIIVPFKDRLLLLNTVENIGGTNRSFVNRLRYSQNGNPVQTTAGQEAFNERRPGKGGYLDAPTKEAIITAQFLYDRLIVYFEQSTWEVVYTGNEVLPFRWQLIDGELGAESTFSQVPFNKVVLGVGNVGIHACTGTNTDRIDSKIPDEVFAIHNVDNGVERVAGIRDYFVEMVYWTFPAVNANTDFPYPNRILVYNYKTGAWAFNDDSITAWGYYQPNFGLTWADAEQTWDEFEAQWNSGSLQAQFRNVLAGNQQGYVFIVDPDEAVNAPCIQITNMAVAGNFVRIEAPQHNLRGGEYIRITNAQGVNNVNGRIYQVFNPADSPTEFFIREVDFSGTYLGGGTLARVSNIQISTKQFNFFAQQGRNLTINKIDFLVDKTDFGQISVELYPSTGLLPVQRLTLDTAPYALYPNEENQTQLWHPIYPNVDGSYIQMRLLWTDEQIRNPLISLDDFQLHAMIINARPSSLRLQ